MTVTYYKLAQPYIKVMQEWLYTKLGFRPTATQVVRYCIYNINAINEDLLYLVKGQSGIGIRTVSVKIRQEEGARVQRTTEELQGYGVNMTMILTIIIIIQGEVARGLHKKHRHLLSAGREVKVIRPSTKEKWGHRNKLAPTNATYNKPQLPSVSSSRCDGR